MEPNTAIRRILSSLLENYQESTDPESFEIITAHQSPKTSQEFSIDNLITARDSLQRYPLPIENIYEELGDIEGFSERLVLHVSRELGKTGSSTRENDRHTHLTQELVSTQHSATIPATDTYFVRFLEALRNAPKGHFEMTLFVDSRERGKSESLSRHLSKDIGSQCNRKALFESSFDEFLNDCLSSTQISPATRKKPKVKAAKALSEFNYTVNEVMLPVGDMIWVSRNKIAQKEAVLPIIIERKTVNDLAISLTDGRFHVQAERIQDCGLPWRLYIIEGSLDDSSQVSVPQQALRTAIHTLVHRYRFHVYNTNNLRETLILLKGITRFLKHLVSSYNVLDSLELYSQRSFSQWVADVQEKDLRRKKVDCFSSMLSSIDGVGSEAALKIAQIFETPLHLFEHFHEVFLAQGELHAEFCLTKYRAQVHDLQNKPLKLCSGTASSSIYEAFYKGK